MSDHLEILLSDTVGFIAKLPHHLIEAFQATLEELQYADLLLHVIDASDPHREAHIEVVDRLIDKLAKPGVPVLRCYNKADLVGDVSNLPIGEKNIPMCAQRHRHGRAAHAHRGATGWLHRAVFLLPYSDAGALAQLHEQAQVLRVDYLPEGVEVEAVCREELFGRLKRFCKRSRRHEGISRPHRRRRGTVHRAPLPLHRAHLPDGDGGGGARAAEADARAVLDATHNVYAYIIRDGATRFSDDGEPGGTAGMPVLQVLQREELYNVTCVVTRYFGGILLGAGGLVRAYAHGAKIAVDAAGRSIKRIWTNVYLPCPYSWYERIRLEVAAFGGMIRETQFGADVELDLLLPEEQTQGFLERVTDLSAGTIEGLIGKQEYRAFPLP